MNISNDDKKKDYYYMSLIYVCLKLYGINYREILLQLDKYNENNENNENNTNNINNYSGKNKTIIQFYNWICNKNGNLLLDNFHNYIFYDYETFIPSNQDLYNLDKSITNMYISLIQY